MKLNHLHIKVSDMVEAREFFEKYFSFELAFDHDPGVFLKDPNGFLLAIDPRGLDDNEEFPPWFHIGFALDSAAEVKDLYERMQAGGVEFSRDYAEFDGMAANFYCWGPGDYKIEVSWNKD